MDAPALQRAYGDNLLQNTIIAINIPRQRSIFLGKTSKSTPTYQITALNNPPELSPDIKIFLKWSKYKLLIFLKSEKHHQTINISLKIKNMHKSN